MFLIFTLCWLITAMLVYHCSATLQCFENVVCCLILTCSEIAWLTIFKTVHFTNPLFVEVASAISYRWCVLPLEPIRCMWKSSQITPTRVSREFLVIESILAFRGLTKQVLSLPFSSKVQQGSFIFKRSGIMWEQSFMQCHPSAASLRINPGQLAVCVLCSVLSTPCYACVLFRRYLIFSKNSCMISKENCLATRFTGVSFTVSLPLEFSYFLQLRCEIPFFT